MEKISENKSKILVIGATGMIGRFLVSASIKAGHPTFMLVRTNTVATDHDKAKLVEDFKSRGVVVVTGDVHDHGSLVGAFKQVDVVISAVGHKFREQLADQIKIIRAIKEAGNVKVIREEGIPHTFVCSNCFQGFFLPRFGQPEAEHPPTDKVIILGDGNPQAIFVNENDMGAYTIKAVDDPRTLNKTLFISPPANFYSLNQLVSLWEKKIGRTLEKIHVSEEDVLKKIQESSYPLSFQFAIAYSVFVKGELTNRAIDPSIAVEATELYPEIKYVKVEDYLDCIM
ncbi:isoflavone reductase-like protein isoform X2 [Ananas comosus]|uniref:Isoflavone reductase-like protein isoform X2 n=1 Tax=Ananas comosus TaxID=4615 RepID=A0A6P5FYU0_ANACO|nr:isoflavone reductase-like protein isoform X2 [Ananas comosus]